jgi:hypothetical protein
MLGVSVCGLSSVPKKSPHSFIDIHSMSGMGRVSRTGPTFLQYADILCATIRHNLPSYKLD